VVAGALGWLNDSVRERVGKVGLDESVRFPGYIARDDVVALYSLATVFA